MKAVKEFTEPKKRDLNRLLSTQAPLLFTITAPLFLILCFTFESAKADNIKQTKPRFHTETVNPFPMELKEEPPTLKDCGVLTSEYNLKNGILTDYWAQEMIGADLLKQNIKQAPPLKENIHLISVWDEGNHGDLVTHLISDEGPSALLPPLGAPQLTRSYIPNSPLRSHQEGFYLYRSCLDFQVFTI